MLGAPPNPAIRPEVTVDEFASPSICSVDPMNASTAYWPVCKQVVSPRYEINQLFELVRQAEVPHWSSYHDSIGALKALD